MGHFTVVIKIKIFIAQTAIPSPGFILSQNVPTWGAVGILRGTALTGYSASLAPAHKMPHFPPLVMTTQNILHNIFAKPTWRGVPPSIDNQ